MRPKSSSCMLRALGLRRMLRRDLLSLLMPTPPPQPDRPQRLPPEPCDRRGPKPHWALDKRNKTEHSASTFTLNTVLLLACTKIFKKKSFTKFGDGGKHLATICVCFNIQSGFFSLLIHKYQLQRRYRCVDVITLPAKYFRRTVQEHYQNHPHHQHHR